MKEFEIFPAKILLFGEHIINKGSNGLATPFPKYYCSFSYEKTALTLNASQEVLELISKQINESENLSSIIDLVEFEQDIHNGLHINMNIPIGYGLGSSGAICAGVYNHYCHFKTENPTVLKKILGEMEGAFHGKSSGLDPLVSYLNKSVLVTEDYSKVIDFSLAKNTTFNLFLIDTQHARKTAPLVNNFLAKYETNINFSELIDATIVPLTNAIIEDFVSNNLEKTYSKIKQLSALHLENFQELILEKHISIWQKALKNDAFYLKICGAGGGGFMLGFCKDKKEVLDVFDSEEIIFL